MCVVEEYRKEEEEKKTEKSRRAENFNNLSIYKIIKCLLFA
jgi:hypothetical protein